jgi:Na+-translocating ferredoxin:NAD+ oxidoreductase RnfC subunit
LFFLAKKKRVRKQTQERRKKNKHNKRFQDSRVCDDVRCSLLQYKEQTAVAKKTEEENRQIDKHSHMINVISESKRKKRGKTN